MVINRLATSHVYVKKLTKISPTLSQVEVSADKFKLRKEVKKETVEDIQAKNIKIDKEIEKITKEERGSRIYTDQLTFPFCDTTRSLLLCCFCLI
ncbi:hypothetical protein [Bacillus haynesii]|uniref:hypothetical protein n=1 Tax=Bacillus haynesii TaxID=1925021 RepID=UPI00227FDF63|nr:hypothetical protein [Bacillus haynesii]MCY8140770.1 hypothetical protein [Bacillus haynesii]